MRCRLANTQLIRVMPSGDYTWPGCGVRLLFTVVGVPEETLSPGRRRRYVVCHMLLRLSSQCRVLLSILPQLRANTDVMSMMLELQRRVYTQTPHNTGVSVYQG